MGTVAARSREKLNQLLAKQNKQPHQTKIGETKVTLGIEEGPLTVEHATFAINKDTLKILVIPKIQE